MIDLKTDLLKSVTDRLEIEIREARSIGEDLKVQGDVDEVTLTRLETHATKLEVYTDMLRDLLKTASHKEKTNA
jgi:hypothetical protein